MRGGIVVPASSNEHLLGVRRFAARQVPALRFDTRAQEVFDAWRDDLEQRLRSEEMAPSLEAHVAKYRSLMPSPALLFELIDTEGLPVSVGKTAALRAVAWCEYLETHAGRLYASAGKPAMEGAWALLDDDLVGRGLGGGHVLPVLELLGPPVAGEQNRLHFR